MEDRLMTIKQLAEYLRVNDRTVLKLVSDGTLPGVKVGSQWRFRKAMIDTWLDDQMLGLTPKYLDPPRPIGAPRRMLELASCFQADHIVPALEAVTKNMVIEEMAGLAAHLGLIRDKTWFVGALIERENVMPSARGGIAFLHASAETRSRSCVRSWFWGGRGAAWTSTPWTACRPISSSYWASSSRSSISRGSRSSLRCSRTRRP
jgi:excisionase family DNA binding protein